MRIVHIQKGSGRWDVSVGGPVLLSRTNHRSGVCSPVDLSTVYNVLRSICLVLHHVGKSCEKKV